MLQEKLSEATSAYQRILNSHMTAAEEVSV